MEITSWEIDKVKKLIFVLLNCQVLSKEERTNKSEQFREDTFTKMAEGQNFGQAIGMHPILNQTEEDFKTELKRNSDNLSSNVAVFAHNFSLYLEKGEIPAPYFAWRIAVILSKAKLKTLEYEFLAAWCRHFSDCNTSGSRYEKLISRFNKLKMKIDRPI